MKKYFIPSVCVSVLLGTFGVLQTSPVLANNYVADDQITIDNQITSSEGWESAVIDDGEDSTDRMRYCFNLTTLDWDSITDPAACPESVMFDEGGQYDIDSARIAFDADHLYLAYTSMAALYGLTDTDGSFISLAETPALTQRNITTLPNDFSHDIVFDFDQNPIIGETTYDWYVVVHLNYSFGSGVDAGSADSLVQLYQESGVTAGYQADEDTIAVSFTDDQMEAATIPNVSPIYSDYELKLDMPTFLEATGFAFGDTFVYSMETHSFDGDSTPGVAVQLADSKIMEDAVVVGSAAKTFSGRTPTRFAKGIFTVYADSDQSVLLSVTAYSKKIGVQVAQGDVDGDGEVEVVTMPFKSQKRPKLKVFDLNGTLEASITIPGKANKRLHQYHLSVGNVNTSNRDEIVLSNASGSGVFIDVLKLTNAGQLKRLDQYVDTTQTGYTAGAWVEVADVDTSSAKAEILTAPVTGDAVIDIWKMQKGAIQHLTDYSEIQTAAGYTGGLHITAHNGRVVAATHGKNGAVSIHDWVEAKGNLDPTDTEFTIGSIGDIAFNSNGLFYSKLAKKKTLNVDSDGATLFSIDTLSKGSFLALIDVE